MRELNLTEMSQIHGGADNQHNFTAIVDSTVSGAVVGVFLGILFLPAGTSSVGAYASVSAFCAGVSFLAASARVGAQLADNYYFPPTPELEVV